MLEFIKNNPIDIISIIGLVALIIFLFKKGRKDLVAKLALKAIQNIEKNESFDIDLFREQSYNKLPNWIKFLVPKSQFDKSVDDAIYLAKDLLDNGVIDGSYPKQEQTKIILNDTVATLNEKRL